MNPELRHDFEPSAEHPMVCKVEFPSGRKCLKGREHPFHRPDPAAEPAK